MNINLKVFHPGNHIFLSTPFCAWSDWLKWSGLENPGSLSNGCHCCQSLTCLALYLREIAPSLSQLVSGTFEFRHKDCLLRQLIRVMFRFQKWLTIEIRFFFLIVIFSYIPKLRQKFEQKKWKGVGKQRKKSSKEHHRTQNYELVMSGQFCAFGEGRVLGSRPGLTDLIFVTSITSSACVNLF